MSNILSGHSLFLLYLTPMVRPFSALFPGILSALISSITFFSCSNKTSSSFTYLASPLNGSSFKSGAPIDINVTPKDNDKIDSVQIFIDDKAVKTLTSAPFNYKWNTSGSKLGTKKISTAAYSGSNKDFKTVNLTIISDIIPAVYTYSVERTYPHNKDFFTEGLFYDGNYLYESTGLKGKSSFMKIQIATGKIIKEAKLPPQYFGEGITMLNGKIYQLTWQSKVGFIYDAETFEKTGDFTYQTEGWGMTNNGKELIMTDGSNIIHFLDPSSLKENSSIAVYDDKSPVQNLNEIEYVEGDIYANIWKTTKILQIDASSGKVKAVIELAPLLEDEYKTNKNIDVMNGIAYNSKNKTLLITGKLWQHIYEIKINK